MVVEVSGNSLAVAHDGELLSVVLGPVELDGEPACCPKLSATRISSGLKAARPSSRTTPRTPSLPCDVAMGTRSTGPSPTGTPSGAITPTTDEGSVVTVERPEVKTRPAAEPSIEKRRASHGATSAPWVAITSSRESSFPATTLTMMPSASDSSEARWAIRASHWVDAAATEHRQPDFGDRTQPTLPSLSVDQQAAEFTFGTLARRDVSQDGRDAGRCARRLPNERKPFGHLELVPVLMEAHGVTRGDVHSASHPRHLLLDVGSQSVGDQVA